MNDPRPPLWAQVPEGYESLARVLQEALEQASAGKGKERHAGEGEAFEDQQIVQLGEWLGTNHFQLGQAAKKLLESARLPPDRARREILGAINYLAAAVIQQDRATRLSDLVQMSVTRDSVGAQSKFNAHIGWADNRIVSAEQIYADGRRVKVAPNEAIYPGDKVAVEVDDQGHMVAVKVTQPDFDAQLAEQHAYDDAVASQASDTKWTGLTEDGQAVMETPFEQCVGGTAWGRCTRATGHAGPHSASGALRR